MCIRDRVYDDLFDAGYDLRMVNGALGSLSFIRQTAGFCEFWNANQASPAANPLARIRRPALGSGDRGDNGTVMAQNISGGKVGLFYCSAGGASVYTAYSGATPIPTSSPPVTDIDYIYAPAAGGTGAATTPFSAYAGGVGGTVTDGGLTWTCVCADIAGASESAYRSLAQGTVLTDGKFGFDPLGVCRRLHESMQAVQGVSERWIYIQNAQSDVFTNGSWYQASLLSIVNYFLARGYKVMVGLSCYNNAGANTTAYNNLQTQRNAALASLIASYPSRVAAGADLYSLMGSTPGSNGLSFQADNVHLDAPSALVAGGHIANALKAALPVLIGA